MVSCSEQFAQTGVAEFLLTLRIARLLQRQRLVECTTAGTGKAAQIALLYAGQHPGVFEGLAALHGERIVRFMCHENAIRHGRQCVFLMPAHLVLVTRCRREGFTRENLDNLRGIFDCLCATSRRNGWRSMAGMITSIYWRTTPKRLP